MRGAGTGPQRTWLVAALLLAASNGARAEVGVGVFAETDDRLRGVSLTDGKPAFGATLSYDHASGVYAGGSILGVADPGGQTRLFGYVDDLGYAHRIGSRLSLDVGIVNAHGSLDPRQRALARKRAFDYSEAHAGLASDNFSAHVAYSPAYLGMGRTVYTDLDVVMRPAERWRLFGRLGALTPLDPPGRYGSRRPRYDLRAGGAVEVGKAELELAWTTTTPDQHYAAVYLPPKGALALSVKYFF